MKNTRQMFLSLFIMLTLLFSSFGAIHVYADDVTPVPEATEEGTVDDGSPEASSEPQATEEAAADPTEAPAESEETATEAPADGENQEATEAPSTPTEEATVNTPIEETTVPTEESVAEETVEATEEVEPTEEPTAEPTPMLSDEELDTLPEILENVPEGTDVVVLDENGDVASMASEEAAETLVKGDPIWCPDGVSPIANTDGCTDSFTSFSALIAALEADAGTTYNGDGTIWVAYNYQATEDNDTIIFDGSDSDLSGISSNSLTIQGGWDGASGSTDLYSPTSVSTIDVALVVAFWQGDVTINNIFVNNTTDNDAGLGLYVVTDGEVVLNDVQVSGTTGSITNEGDGDGAFIYGTSNVTINDSTFISNDGIGLNASSDDELTLNNVTANSNTYDGAYLGAENLVQVIDSHFNENDGAGIYAFTSGTITVTGSSANDNTIGGAYLDSYTYFGGPVNVYNSEFSGNHTNDGLYIDSGGSTYLSAVTAQDNDMYGVYIENGTSALDTLTVNGGIFSGNGTAGIYAYQYSDGMVTLANIASYDNGTGAIIYSEGSTGVGVYASQFYENDYSGLHVESVGNIILNNVYAGAYLSNLGNNANGAYLISDETIQISDSYFNDNAKFSNASYRGLYVSAGENIILGTVTANDNTNGSGAELVTTGSGSITLNGGNIFNNNGTYGVQATVTDGQLVMNANQASNNTLKGAYLIALGNSEILMNADTFTENGSYGVYATTENGNITDSGSTYTGNDVTGTGAKFYSSGGGTITISGGTFQSIQGNGLDIVTDGVARLQGVVSQNNGGNGVAIYSTYTVKKCYHEGDTNTSVIVYVTGGLFQNNGQYGVYVKPGDEGTVDITTNPPSFLNNTKGDYLIDTSAIPECTDCGCTLEKPEGKPYNIINAPFSGSGDIPQDCTNFAGTIINLPDGTFVKVACPFDGFSNLQGITEADLPGILGSNFDLGILLGLLGNDGSYVLNSDGTITLNFIIPETSLGRSHRLLFWDTAMNDGAGGWFQVPPYEEGSSFPLHPDDPDDTRLIVSGVVRNGNVLSVTVNFAGYFVVTSN